MHRSAEEQRDFLEGKTADEISVLVKDLTKETKVYLKTTVKTFISLLGKNI